MCICVSQGFVFFSGFCLLALYLQNANYKLFTALQLAIVGLQVLVAGSNGLRSEGQPGELVAFKYGR